MGRGRGGRGRGRGGNDRYCSHCDFSGHTRETCYTLHPELRPLRAARVAATNDMSIVSSPTPGLSEEYIVNLVKNLLLKKSSSASSLSGTPATLLASIDKGLGNEDGGWFRP